MTKRELYISNVKKGIKVYEAMAALEDRGNMYIKYGNRGTFEINASVWKNMPTSYSIGDGELFGRRMNIDMEKSGKSFLYVYTYDLFNNKSFSKLAFEHITITEKPEDETK